MPDLDQGGTFRETTRIYLGPSLGWSQGSAPPSAVITVGAVGTVLVQQGTSIVHVNVNGSVTVQLFAARGNAAGAGQVPGSYIQTVLTVNDVGGYAQAFPITILPAVGETISGSNSFILSANYGLVTLLADVLNGGWTAVNNVSGAALTDAPNDGSAYGRQSAAWGKVVPLAGGTMTGALTAPTVIVSTTATVPTVATADNSTNAASTAFVKAQAYAPLASPTLTGVPAGPTAALGTNTTQLATTAFVKTAITGATFQGSPANPTGTVSGSGVMMGLGGTCKITPATTGRIKVEFVGTTFNNTASANNNIAFRYGTGAAPANAAAPSGTVLGTALVVTTLAAITGTTPFVIGGIVTGLTVGTAYWFDLVIATTAGTGSVNNLSCDAFEF